MAPGGAVQDAGPERDRPGAPPPRDPCDCRIASSTCLNRQRSGIAGCAAGCAPWIGSGSEALCFWHCVFIISLCMVARARRLIMALHLTTKCDSVILNVTDVNIIVSQYYHYRA